MIFFNPTFFIPSITLVSGSRFRFKNFYFFIFIVLYTYLQKYLPLALVLVQRLYFGLKCFVPFMIVLNMTFLKRIQWFLIASFVPLNVFLDSFYKISHFWRRKILFDKIASITRISTFQSTFLISFNRIKQRFFSGLLRSFSRNELSSRIVFGIFGHLFNYFLIFVRISSNEFFLLWKFIIGSIFSSRVWFSISLFCNVWSLFAMCKPIFVDVSNKVIKWYFLWSHFFKENLW